MKIKTNLQLFYASCFILMFSSCSNELELNIQDLEIDRLVSFVEEANLIAQQYEGLTGPKGSEIFGNNKSAVCGNEHDFIGPCIWAIDDMIKELGYRDVGEINQWMTDTGVLLYGIKKKNEDFETQTELINEIACLVAPEILTRNQDNTCYKDNLVALLNGALNGKNNHTTNNNGKTLTKDQMYQVGSSFYKIWRYMVNSDKCN